MASPSTHSWVHLCLLHWGDKELGKFISALSPPEYWRDPTALQLQPWWRTNGLIDARCAVVMGCLLTTLIFVLSCAHGNMLSGETYTSSQRHSSSLYTDSPLIPPTLMHLIRYHKNDTAANRHYVGWSPLFSTLSNFCPNLISNRKFQREWFSR